MSKPKASRDVQVRHRLSGAALLGVREPTPPTMAIDAAPRVSDPARPYFTDRMISLHQEQAEDSHTPRPQRVGTVFRPMTMRGTFLDEEAPPVVTEIDDE